MNNEPKYKYETDVRCPVCKMLLWQFRHDNTDFKNSVMILNAITSRQRTHGKESPACTMHPDWEHPDWDKGCLCEVHEIVPVRVDFLIADIGVGPCKGL